MQNPEKILLVLDDDSMLRELGRWRYTMLVESTLHFSATCAVRRLDGLDQCAKCKTGTTSRRQTQSKALTNRAAPIDGETLHVYLASLVTTAFGSHEVDFDC